MTSPGTTPAPWLLVALVLAASAWAQFPSVMADAGRENLPAQQLGVDDLLAVSVYDSPELTRTVRVEADGSIHLPLLRGGIAAAGIFPRQVESSVAEALVAEQILVDPVVKVTVVEYHSRPIAVMGEVRKPLTFQAVGAVTLLEALARAEGLSPDAGTEVLLTRDGNVERIPVNRLLKDADPAVNYPLHGGEEIRVPEAGRIFVAGNVKKPGAFPVREVNDGSVMNLVALSEGLLPFASKTAYIYRRDEAGARKELPIELDRIMQRKSPDVALQAGDILYIPDNKNRRTAMGLIDRLTSFGASTASGVIIWH